jgi:hypothetical protein
VVTGRLALTAADFDVFGVGRTASNASSRPQLERRVLGWARAVAARLAGLGLAVELAGAEDRGADGHGVRFSRDAAARAALERDADAARGFSTATAGHAFLALRVDAAGVEICFSLPDDARIDRVNFRARLADPPAAAEFVAALEALPDEFTIGVDARSDAPCSTAAPGLLERLIGDGRGAIWIGWRVARDTAVEHAELLDEQLEDALVALAPIYRLVAWARDNDLVGLAPSLTRSVAWLRARGPAGPSRSTGGSVEKGGRVRVRRGPFADKVGTVSELDGRGAARVMLGLLSSRFDLAELEPIVEGKDRPTFQSSHRRPLAPVPRKAR